MTESKKEETLVLAALSWGAFIAVVLIVVCYLSCQHTDERVQQCITSGKSPKECRCAFNYHHYNCD